MIDRAEILTLAQEAGPDIIRLGKISGDYFAATMGNVEMRPTVKTFGRNRRGRKRGGNNMLPVNLRQPKRKGGIKGGGVVRVNTERPVDRRVMACGIVPQLLW